MIGIMKYPGGKGQLYQKLINLMPPHEVYIESYLGGGAIMRHKRPAGKNIGIERDPEVIEKWRRAGYKIDFELLCTDAVQYLKSYPFTGKELVYCDPPYPRETRNRGRRLYKYEYSLDQHRELLGVLKSLPCKVMLSGYQTELYSESLKDWTVKSFSTTTRHAPATEWVWMNYPVPVKLHDYRHLGNNFRERERIKRIKENWVSRLKKMPVLERQGLLSVMEELKEDINDCSEKD